MKHDSLSDLIGALEYGTKLHISVHFRGSWGNAKTQLPFSRKIHQCPVCDQAKSTPETHHNKMCTAKQFAVHILYTFKFQFEAQARFTAMRAWCVCFHYFPDPLGDENTFVINRFLRSSVTERGSDATTAGGGEKELSEWQRSIADEGGNAKEDIGYRNRIGK